MSDWTLASALMVLSKAATSEASFSSSDDDFLSAAM
jgi:hypothetical protein